MTSIRPRENAPNIATTTSRGVGSLPTVIVSREVEASLRRGHPWIYRDHLPRTLDLASGTWLQVECGNVRAIGIFDADSPLAVRIYSRHEVPDANWFEAAIARAARRRRTLLESGETNAYRLVNGEGDGLPGIVVDVYGHFAVLRLDSRALAGLVPWILSAVERAADVKGICEKGSDGLVILSGRPPPERLIVSEYGLRFFADIGSGQKTGLFLDHRENRHGLARFCAGASVLNLFSYTGGFSLHAARAGARRIVSVDRAGEAMSRAKDNVELNGLDPSLFEFVTADAIKYLEQIGRERQAFDVVITDPPSFARNRMQRRRALRAYERLHALALDVLAPGGVYAAASCTSQIDVETFRGSVALAAERAGRPLQIVLESGQALDHPVMISHPEGRYLKFIALRSVND